MREIALLENRVKYIICKQLGKFLASDVNYLYEKSWRLCFWPHFLSPYVLHKRYCCFVRYRRHAASSTSTSYCHDIWAISHAAAVWLRAFQTDASSRETRSIRRKDCHSESCLSIRHSRTKGHCRCVDCSWLFVCCCCCCFVVLFFNYLWFAFYVFTSYSTRWFCTTYLRYLLLENVH